MIKMRYIGTDVRDFLYPRSFRVKPNEVIEFDDDETPDPYWFALVADKPSPTPRADKEF